MGEHWEYSFGTKNESKPSNDLDDYHPKALRFVFFNILGVLGATQGV